MLSRLYNWVSLKDYDAEKKMPDVEMDEAMLAKLSRQADASMKRLEKRIP